MKKMAVLAALLLIFPAVSLGQGAPKPEPIHGETGCKIYFGVYWADSHIPGGLAPGMQKEQVSWYNKTGKKKYPSVCLDSAKATYVIVWSSSMKPGKITLPVQNESTTYISGDVNATARAYSPGTQTFGYETNNVYLFVFRKKDAQHLEE